MNKCPHQNIESFCDEPSLIDFVCEECNEKVSKEFFHMRDYQKRNIQLLTELNSLQDLLSKSKVDTVRLDAIGTYGICLARHDQRLSDKTWQETWVASYNDMNTETVAVGETIRDTLDAVIVAAQSNQNISIH